MRKELLVFGVAFVVFLVIDLIWLSLIAKNLYREELGSLLLERFKLAPAIIFYLLFIAGLAFFVIVPSLESSSFLEVLLKGAFFGLVAYATYDLTNLATLAGWPLKITIIDLIWGTSLGGLVSTLTYFIVRLF